MNISAAGHQIQSGLPAESRVCVDGCVGMFVCEQRKKVCVCIQVCAGARVCLCALQHRGFAIHHTTEGCYRNTFPQPHGY